MRVLFINDSTSNPNWGDRAAAVSLKAMIEAAGGDISATVTEHDLKTSTFFSESYLPEDLQESRFRATVRLMVPPILLRLRRHLISEPDVTAANRRIPATWEEFPRSAAAVLRHREWQRLLSAMEAADVAIIHGNGAMVDNGIIPRTDLFLTYLLKNHFGKPVIIVNHTADFNHPNLQQMAAQVYPLFDDVVFRDQISVERCAGLCAGRFAADSAFWFTPARGDAWTSIVERPTYFDVWPDSASFRPSQPYVCIGGSSKFAYEKPPFPIRQGYREMIRHLRTVYRGQIVMTASDLTDLAMFRPIARELDLPLLGVTVPVQQAVDVLGNADAYIGGRWHPGIFALRGGAPVLPIVSKTFKMQALTEMAGLPSATFDVFDLNAEKEAIARELVSLLDTGADLRARIRARADELGQNSWGNVRYLAGW